MKIADKIEMLEISSTIMEKLETIYPTLMWDDHNTILIDTGYPNQLEKFQEAMHHADVSFNRLNKIIITHHDIDHMGSLSIITKESKEDIEILAHPEEKPYIQGEKQSIKLAALEAQLDSLPQQTKPVYEGFKRFYDSNKINIDRTITDGEILPYCGGIAVIYTPGHTPGHICLYHIQSKTLIAGDMLSIEEGILIKAPSFTHYDKVAAKKSLEKLTQYDIEVVICYHGGIYEGNVNHRILELTKQH